ARAAPGVDEVALRVELEDRRRRQAALSRGRVLRRAQLRARVAVAAVDDEDVVARVHAHADRGTQDPVVGQGLGPERVYLEDRGLLGRPAGGRLERRLPGGERRDRDDEGRTEDDVAFAAHARPPGRIGGPGSTRGRGGGRVASR